MKLICPFCGKLDESDLPADCTRCEATDGPGTGTPMVEFVGIKYKCYKPYDGVAQNMSASR